MDPRDLSTALDWFRGGHLTGPQGLPADPNKDAIALEVQASFRMFPRVADLLMRMTLLRPAVDYTLPKASGEFDQYALLREGQNSVAVAFLDYLDHADKLTRRATDAQAMDDGHGGQPGDDGPGWGRFNGPDFAIS